MILVALTMVLIAAYSLTSSDGFARMLLPPPGLNAYSVKSTLLDIGSWVVPVALMLLAELWVGYRVWGSRDPSRFRVLLGRMLVGSAVGGALLLVVAHSPILDGVGVLWVMIGIPLGTLAAGIYAAARAPFLERARERFSFVVRCLSLDLALFGLAVLWATTGIRGQLVDALR
jgi:hypothetical protein